VEKLQDLPDIQGVGLGWVGEDLLELGQLQIVHVVEAVLPFHDHPVQGAGVAVVALHGYRDGEIKLLATLFHLVKELFKVFLRARDRELPQGSLHRGQRAPPGGSCNLHLHRHGSWSSPRGTSFGVSSSVSRLQAGPHPKGRHHPGGHRLDEKRGRGSISDRAAEAADHKSYPPLKPILLQNPMVEPAAYPGLSAPPVCASFRRAWGTLVAR